MWQKRINVAVIVLLGLLVVSIALPGLEQQREAARRTQSRNNLKQIGLALFNYESTYQVFPPGGVFNLSGRGFHGWMTSILPFLESSPFYSKVIFEEPWDSTRNAGLFLNRVPCYENPSEPIAHRHWEFPVAHYSANPYLLTVNSFTKLESIENQAKMFAVGELVGGFVPWGCPYNWRELDGLNSQRPTSGRSSRDGCQLLFVDGRVEFVANATSKEVLKRMSGEDLTGFNANVLNIQTPSTFPCPNDALRLTWSYREGGRVETKQDIHGKVISVERFEGK